MTRSGPTLISDVEELPCFFIGCSAEESGGYRLTYLLKLLYENILRRPHIET